MYKGSAGFPETLHESPERALLEPNPEVLKDRDSPRTALRKVDMVAHLGFYVSHGQNSFKGAHIGIICDSHSRATRLDLI